MTKLEEKRKITRSTVKSLMATPVASKKNSPSRDRIIFSSQTLTSGQNTNTTTPVKKPFMQDLDDLSQIDNIIKVQDLLIDKDVVTEDKLAQGLYHSIKNNFVNSAPHSPKMASSLNHTPKSFKRSRHKFATAKLKEEQLI